MKIGTVDRRALLALAALLLALACQGPTQRVSLLLEPSSASLFVDGEEMPTIPAELVLESDRAHVLFFRKSGFQSQRVVLESAERDGEAILQPSEVHVRLLRTIPSDRELVIEPAAP